MPRSAPLPGLLTPRRAWRASLACVGALLVVGLVGCGGADGHDDHDHHDHHNHDHDQHSHAQPASLLDSEPHVCLSIWGCFADRNPIANDSDVVDIVYLTPDRDAAPGLVAGAALEASGGQLTWQGGLLTAEAMDEALSKAGKFSDAVVVETAPGIDADAFAEVIRRAGLRGVRVLVVGEPLGQAGIDYISLVRADASADVPQQALREAGLTAALQAAGDRAADLSSVIVVEAEAS